MTVKRRWDTTQLRGSFAHSTLLCLPTNSPLRPTSLSQQCLTIFSRKNLLFSIISALCIFTFEMEDPRRFASRKMTRGRIAQLVLVVFVSATCTFQGGIFTSEDASRLSSWTVVSIQGGIPSSCKCIAAIDGDQTKGTMRTGALDNNSNTWMDPSSTAAAASITHIPVRPSSSRLGVTVVGKRLASSSCIRNGFRMTQMDCFVISRRFSVVSIMRSISNIKS